MSGAIREMRPKPMKAVFDRLVYETEKSVLIASDAYYDGKNWERHGTNTFLYKTKNGRYFKQFQSANQPEEDYMKPLSESEAITLYSELKTHDKSFDEAFPGVSLEEA